MNKFAKAARHFVKKHRAGVQERAEWNAFLKRYELPSSLARTSYSMDIQDFEAVLNTARSYRAKRSVTIVELGSGVSTLVLAGVLPSIFDDAQITSIESEKKRAEQVQAMLREHKLERCVRVCWIPYTLFDSHCWFTAPALKRALNEKHVDILIVDAPPGWLCRCARQPAIPFFLPYLTKDSIVMLHDASRPDESRIVTRWSHYFRVCYQIKTPRGFAVLEGKKQLALK